MQFNKKQVQVYIFYRENMKPIELKAKISKTK